MILAALLAIAAQATVVDSEREFAREAQLRGQWTAFRQYAGEDGLMFVPEPVNAQQWLATRADPPVSVMWWPAEAYVSCDGTLAATTGPWVRDGGRLVGYFTTIWQRRADGSWKWLLDHGDVLERPRSAGDAVRPRRAACRGRPQSPPAHVDPGTGHGESADNSLSYHWSAQPGGGRIVEVTIWNGRSLETVIRNVVAGGR